MTSLSLMLYGGYLILTGLLLMVIPGFTLGIIGLELESDAWIRVVGILATEIGFYFVIATRRNITEFFAVSVYGRLGVALALSVMALAQLGPIQLLIFAVVDSASAVWTRLSMRADTKRQS